MKLRDANLQVNEKNSFTNPPSCILPSFSKNASRLLLPKRLLKCASKIFFSKYERKVVLLVIYLLNYDSSKSTFFHVEYGVWLCLGYGFCQADWNLLQYITKITKTFFFSQPVFWCVVLFDKKLIFLDHGDILFYSVLTSVSNTDFQQ